MSEVRKPRTRRTVLLLLAPCLMSTCLHAQYGGGTGEPNDPYLIYTPEQMNAIGANPSDWDKHFKLMADIDLGQYTGEQFNVIGYHGDWPDLKPFCGVFEGNGHVTSNFTWSSDSRNYVGLFGYVDRKWVNGNPVGTSLPEISNLGLRNCSVSARPDATAGVLAGYLSQGKITNCRVEDSRVSGGLVGILVGNNAYGTIAQCYTTGAAVSKDGLAGGLVYGNSGTVINCYSVATVNGYRSAGGLIASNWNVGTVVNCYATGNVSGTLEFGGLVGGGDGAVISSYWDCEASQRPESPGGGYGKSTAEMRQSVTFVGWTSPSGEPMWTIDEGNDYPRLYWENRAGAVLAGPQLRDFLSGSGRKDDPFLIQTAEQLNLVGQCAYDWDKQFKLTADISLARYTSTGFNIIGASGVPFTGVFDGDHHAISGFHYARNRRTGVGIFGWVSGDDATIENVDVVRPSIAMLSATHLGGLVGCLESGTVADCSVEDIDVAVYNSGFAGGLVGANDGGTIKNCHATGKLYAQEFVGGLVGYNNGGSIQDSSATADVTATREWAGGLAGGNSNGGVITGCFSRGSVTAPLRAGGLVGSNSFETVVKNCYTSCAVTGHQVIGGLLGENLLMSWVANCYAVGSVSGSDDVGGLIGEDGMQTIVVGCFWDTQASGQATSRKGTGRTTSEMKTTATFLEMGWDFAGEADNGVEDIWWIDEGQDYPRLAWELESGGSGSEAGAEAGVGVGDVRQAASQERQK
jgi:hypothetical protein